VFTTYKLPYSSASGDLVTRGSGFGVEVGGEAKIVSLAICRSRVLRCRNLNRRCPGGGPKVFLFREPSLSLPSTPVIDWVGRQGKLPAPIFLFFFAAPAGFSAFRQRVLGHALSLFREASPLIQRPQDQTASLSKAVTDLSSFSETAGGLSLDGGGRHRQTACNH